MDDYEYNRALKKVLANKHIDRPVLQCGCTNGLNWSEGGYQPCWRSCYKGWLFANTEIMNLWKMLYDE